MYRVLRRSDSRRDLTHPVVNNYFNGSNGWYKVDLSGRIAFAPAEHADMRLTRNGDYSHLYVGGGIELGWGLIADLMEPVNPDLMELQHSLATLPWRKDSITQAFKERYYPEFAVDPRNYPIELFWILSANIQKLREN